MEDNTKNKNLNSIQNELFKFFENVSDETLIGFVDSFVYFRVNPPEEVSKLIEKFLDDNGLTESYPLYVMDILKPNQYLKRCSINITEVIEDIRISLLSVAFQVLKNKKEEPKPKEKKLTNKNFNFIKGELIEILECGERCEIYFNGKEEDTKLLKKVRNLKNN